MTKRLSVGVLLVAVAILAMAMSAYAERPTAKEWSAKGFRDPMVNHDLPLFFRGAAETTWVQVNSFGSGICDPADTQERPDLSADHVWCFEGANGDSSWSEGPGGTSQNVWSHWPQFDPPIAPASKWHVSNFLTNPGPGGTFNAYAGCVAAEALPTCADMAFWAIDQDDGYGDNWNYSLTLDASGIAVGAAGTIEFDLRYDIECDYDYLYLEYESPAGSGTWELVTDVADGSGTPAVFNAVSGNEGISTDCGDDYFGAHDKDVGNVYVHGTSIWKLNVQFPVPSGIVGGLKLRWRGFSDGAWSDETSGQDTEGIASIDNVTVVLNNGNTTVSDTFESGNFNNISTVGPGVAATWTAGGLEGNTYDGWHLSFNPTYKNQGNTCTFSDDWMWAAKPDGGPIPENGFSYYLTSPIIPIDGWNGGVSQYSSYICFPAERRDFSNTLARFYDAGASTWSNWNDFDGYITFMGCEFWNMSAGNQLTQFLSEDTDSLQLAWETLDISADGEFEWGKHGQVQHLIDNVSIGSFDGTATVFTTRAVDIFTDTFSQSDPAHTSFLANADLGQWEGIGGNIRSYASDESLTVQVTDPDGITVAGRVRLYWRHDSSTGPRAVDQVYPGAFNFIPMQFSVPLAPPDGLQGTYRSLLGRDNGSVQDMTASGDGIIWTAGTTVQYYIRVQDDLGNLAYFPGTTTAPEPIFFEFSVLPFGLENEFGENMLLVDDFTRNMVDFQNSHDFDPIGGAGFGTFEDPTFDVPEDMIERALAFMYPTNTLGDGEANPVWDKFDVTGGGSSVQSEPRGVSNAADGVNGYMNDFGAPAYDMIIWSQGSFDQYSYADTTRIELKTYLDNGGELLSMGDNIAFHLGAGGNNADSTILFLSQYMGITFPVAGDISVSDRILSALGVSGQALNGFKFALYGECPIRRTFDRLTLATSTATQTAATVAVYTDGAGADNNRPCVIQNTRIVAGQARGTAAHSAFDISAMANDYLRASYMHQLFKEPKSTTAGGGFGLATSNLGVLVGSTDAPAIASSAFGFDLAQATPNPFSRDTEIKFSVPTRTHVSLEVYNILGQKVRTLVNETMDANSYVRNWDGRSDEGAAVSSGIYFYKLVADRFSETKKVVHMK